MQFGILLRIVGSVEKRQEEIVDQLLKVTDELVGTVNVAVKRHSNRGKNRTQPYSIHNTYFLKLIIKYDARYSANYININTLYTSII